MAEFRTINAVATVTNNIINADGTVSTTTFDVTADGQQVVVVDPYIEIEQTDEGAVVTVTDTRGSTTATIYNGQDGEQGDPGTPGAPGAPGQDGVSPTASVSKVGKTATITVTDANGTTTASVTDGADGTNGNDGVSPVASVSKVGTTATITVTDANGTTTATVSDGTNGTNGTNGQDGVSPVATVSKVGSTATITITDANGTTTASVSDGQVGDKTVIQIRNYNGGFTLTDTDGNRLTWQEVHDAYYSPAGAVFERGDMLFTASDLAGGLVRVFDYVDSYMSDYYFYATGAPEYLFSSGDVGGRVMFRDSQRAVALIVENSGAYYITWYGGSTPLTATEVSSVFLSLESLVFLMPVDAYGTVLAAMNTAATNMSSGAITFEGVIVDEVTLQPTKRVSAVFYVGQDDVLSASPSDIRFYPLTSDPAASGGTDLSLVTTGEKYTWNNKSDFSGSYTDLSNKPTNLSSFTDDLGTSPVHSHSQYLTSHQDISGKQDALTAGDGIDLTSAVISNTQGIEYIVGTQASATNAWTGVSKDSTLKTGKIIAYYLPYAGTSSAATLNLTLSDGTTTGAKALRRTASSTVTTHFAAGNVIIMAYDGTYWKVSAYYDSNNNTVPTGYCTTAAATAAKSATVTYGYRDDPNYFMCVFRYANTANNATLAIGSYATTALPIYVNGARTSSSNQFGAGVILFLFYNNAYWCYNDGRFPIVVNGTVTSIQDELALYTKTASLAAVATSGSYTDLSNKPTIPDISTKQDTLVSGTNIKTINGNSILGSGDLTVGGGGGKLLLFSDGVGRLYADANLTTTVYDAYNNDYAAILQAVQDATSVWVQKETSDIKLYSVVYINYDPIEESIDLDGVYSQSDSLKLMVFSVY